MQCGILWCGIESGLVLECGSSCLGVVCPGVVHCGDDALWWWCNAAMSTLGWTAMLH